MVVLRTQSEVGHAPPPASQYSIVTNLPGWDLAKRLRDGDFTLMSKVVHIYPRFGPGHAVVELGRKIANALDREGQTVFPYLNPDMWPYTQRHITLPQREEHALKPEDVELRCVDLAGHRLYAVLLSPAHTRGAALSWGNPGLGLSVRAAEMLLHHPVVEVPRAPGGPLPEPTWTPDGAAHSGLRERIAGLLRREAISPAGEEVAPADVFLYPTGMAAVFHATNLALELRPGTAVVAGVVFHNTYHHLLEETAASGWKHAGRVDEQGLDELEAWLEGEKAAGRPVSFVLVEFPGNPTLDTPDLPRTKKLAETHGFVLIVDDTISSFANVDVLAHADLLLTSLTKSFSGRSDAMGGSVVLNPLSPRHAALSPLLARRHRNELFEPDAAVLLANSHDFLPRTSALNRNAAAMADLLHAAARDPASPVRGVQYPALLPSRPSYDALLRRPSPELPRPGHGCLLTVEFETVDAAAAFYDRCGFYPSPHLGGHVSIVFPYNMLIFTAKPDEAAYMRELGVKEEGIRISAGLEGEEDLIDTVRDALEAAVEVKRTGKRIVPDSNSE